jgi:hypothetical protein
MNLLFPKIYINYIYIYGCASIYIRCGFKRVVTITRAEQDHNRVAMTAETYPLGFLDEDIRLASEDEIAIASINKNKKDNEERNKARKVMQRVSNTVANGVPIGAKAKAKIGSKSKKAAK